MQLYLQHMQAPFPQTHKKSPQNNNKKPKPGIIKLSSLRILHDISFSLLKKYCKARYPPLWVRSSYHNKRKKICHIFYWVVCFSTNCGSSLHCIKEGYVSPLRRYLVNTIPFPALLFSQHVIFYLFFYHLSSNLNLNSDDGNFSLFGLLMYPWHVG